MTSIITTLPKSLGGMKHLQEKIDYIMYENGFAWWWVKGGNEITVKDSVYIICEGALRGYFGIEAIVEPLSDSDPNEMILITHAGRFRVNDKEVYDLSQEINIEKSDNPLLRIHAERIRKYWSILDDWIRVGFKTIFFRDWKPIKPNRSMKGFQGFRYIRDRLFYAALDPIYTTWTE